MLYQPLFNLQRLKGLLDGGESKKPMEPPEGTELPTAEPRQVRRTAEVRYGP